MHIKGYELQELIGQGGFGAVYRARQSNVEREVAMKIILPEFANHPNFIRSFETEAQLIARLEHPHIVPLYDYWRQPDGAYLVMRLLRGGSLLQRRRAEGAMPLYMLTRMVEQVGSALASAHTNGVIHRDLKPANILLDDEDNAYLSDFGIAKNLLRSNPDEDTGDNLVGSPGYLAPEQALGDPVTVRSDIYSFGIMLFEMLTGQHPYRAEESNPADVLLAHIKDPVPHLNDIRSDLPPTLDHVIQRATAKNPEDRYQDILALVYSFRKAARNSAVETATTEATLTIFPGTIDEPSTPSDIPLPEPENPYKGLRAFKEADAVDFFGRENLQDELLDMVANNRFLAVVGPSGSGKSSVIRAGVMPALRRGRVTHSEQWYYLEMVPGNHPMQELEAALMSIAINPPESLLEQLEHDERGLLRAIKRTLPNSENAELVLYIDQFEELFTQVEDEDERTHFLRNLTTAVMDDRSVVRVIISLRADFYDRPLMYRGFGELLKNNTKVVIPLTPEEIERAIVYPAVRVGLRVEPGLVSKIVADVSEQPGGLPMLQYALTELFDRRDGRTLTAEAYEEIGGTTGALARRAEKLYLGLSLPCKDVAQQLFLRLVTLGEGSEDTRRRVRQSELFSLTSEKADMEHVLDVYGKRRLLTFDVDPASRRPTVEVAHEALIREWERLRGWLDQSRDDVRRQRRLAASAREWHMSNRDPSDLMRGARLIQVESWLAETVVELTAQEREYFEASVAERIRHEQEEAEREAQQLALEQRAENRLRTLVIFMFVATVVALGLMIFALNEQQVAQQERDNAAVAAGVAERSAEEAQSLSLASGAQLAIAAGNTDLALALALEANSIAAPPAPVQRVLAVAAYQPGTVHVYAEHTARVNTLAVSPDGRMLLSGGDDRIIRLWNIRTGELVRTFAGHEFNVVSLDFSPDGETFLSAGASGGDVLIGDEIYLWDTDTGEQLHHYIGHDRDVTHVVFSTDGEMALSASGDTTVIHWDVDSGEMIQRLIAFNAGRFTEVAFTKDQRFALASADDSSIRIWDLETGEEIGEMRGQLNEITSLDINPDDEIVVTGSEDANVWLWDLETGAEIMRLGGHETFVLDVAFSPDGTQIISASADRTLILWDVETGEPLQRFFGHSGEITEVAFSPDARYVYSSSEDGTLRRWALRNNSVLNVYDGHTSGIRDIAISPNGSNALSGAADDTVIYWNAATGVDIHTLEGHDGSVNRVAFHPVLNQGVSGDIDGVIIEWDLRIGTELRRMQAHEADLIGLQYTPDNNYLVTASEDGVIIQWDTDTWEEHDRFTATHPEEMTAVTTDGEVFITGGEEGQIIAWDFVTGGQLRRYTGHTDGINSVQISPDGRRLISASQDETVIVWDLATGDIIHRLVGHDGLVWDAIFHPTLELALSGSVDRTVILWDLARGEEIRVLSGHERAITSLAFSPNGQTALSGSADRNLIRWATPDLNGLVDWTLSNRFIPEFTCSQREQFRILPLCES